MADVLMADWFGMHTSGVYYARDPCTFSHEGVLWKARCIGLAASALADRIDPSVGSKLRTVLKKLQA